MTKGATHVSGGRWAISSVVTRVRAPFVERIAGKIIAPYLVLVLVLAVLATFLVARTIAGTLGDRFANNLLDGGHAANEAMVRIEEEQLQALRLITNTVGIGEALASRDPSTLEALLIPIQVNGQLHLVDVVAMDGSLVVAVRAEGQGQNATSLVDPALGSSPLAQRVLAGTSDALGDKFTDVVATSWGPALYSAAPLRENGTIIGAVLVGTPLDSVLARLARESQANLTLYAADGRLLLTTLPVVGQETEVMLPQTLAAQVLAEPPTLARRGLTIGARPYQELVGSVEVRAHPLLPLGVAVRVSAIQQAVATSSATLVGLFCAVILLVLAVGVALARAITRPLGALVDATERVSAGDLTPEVQITSRDEAGRLSRSFNHMVAGLRERERIRDTFGQFVTTQVMEAVLGGHVTLGGVRQEITVLVSDIRGFTTLSEEIEPEAVVALLNRYFDRMADAILEFEGTLDKFIGDGILVEFGAPLPLEQHALRGVLTALRMREYLAAFNDEQRQRGDPTLRIGIGIHTGLAVVGNVGAEGKKLEYTAMGDTVNVASRLESETKTVGVDLLISAATYAQVRDYVSVGAQSELHVKGRVAPVIAFPVLGLAPGFELGASPYASVAAVVPAPVAPAVTAPIVQDAEPPVLIVRRERGSEAVAALG
jgi:adenylate cyclase